MPAYLYNIYYEHNKALKIIIMIIIALHKPLYVFAHKEQHACRKVAVGRGGWVIDICMPEL